MLLQWLLCFFVLNWSSLVMFEWGCSILVWQSAFYQRWCLLYFCLHEVRDQQLVTFERQGYKNIASLLWFCCICFFPNFDVILFLFWSFLGLLYTWCCCWDDHLDHSHVPYSEIRTRIIFLELTMFLCFSHWRNSHCLYQQSQKFRKILTSWRML